VIIDNSRSPGFDGAAPLRVMTPGVHFMSASLKRSAARSSQARLAVSAGGKVSAARLRRPGFGP
jgi:hypothetical protein